MILNFTQKRLYVCQFVNSKGKIEAYKFSPGDNKIPASEEKFLVKHPGIKNRLDLGILIQKGSVTEDLKGEAEKASKAEKGKLSKEVKVAEVTEEKAKA